MGSITEECEAAIANRCEQLGLEPRHFFRARREAERLGRASEWRLHAGDLASLSLLRVRFPLILSMMISPRTLRALTGLSPLGRMMDAGERQDVRAAAAAKALESLLSRYKLGGESATEPLANLLFSLFPGLEQAARGEALPTTYGARLRRERRFADPLLTDYYLSAQVPPEGVQPLLLDRLRRLLKASSGISATRTLDEVLRNAGESGSARDAVVFEVLQLALDQGSPAPLRNFVLGLDGSRELRGGRHAAARVMSEWMRIAPVAVIFLSKFQSERGKQVHGELEGLASALTSPYLQQAILLHALEADRWKEIAATNRYPDSIAGVAASAYLKFFQGWAFDGDGTAKDLFADDLLSVEEAEAMLWRLRQIEFTPDGSVDSTQREQAKDLRRRWLHLYTRFKRAGHTELRNHLRRWPAAARAASGADSIYEEHLRTLLRAE